MKRTFVYDSNKSKPPSQQQTQIYSSFSCLSRSVVHISISLLFFISWYNTIQYDTHAHTNTHIYAYINFYLLHVFFRVWRQTNARKKASVVVCARECSNITARVLIGWIDINLAIIIVIILSAKSPPPTI